MKVMAFFTPAISLRPKAEPSQVVDPPILNYAASPIHYNDWGLYAAG